PDRMQQLDTVDEILGELGAGEIPRMMIYNKSDRLTPEERDTRSTELSVPAYFITALDRRSTRPLMLEIEQRLWERGRIERDLPIEVETEAEAEAEVAEASST
ncbi:MAG: hypothetical protein ACPG77_14360, partial [Nannocystaceae bacterium]